MNNTKKILKLYICLVFIANLSFAQTYNIADFGAKNDIKVNSTDAIQNAINACNKNGGGTVVFPAGKWISGTVFLKSNVSVYLSNGAVWQGINDTTAYPFLETKIMSRENHEKRKALVYGYDLENIKIYGEGTFYPGGHYEIFQGKEQNLRPWGIYLEACKNITVEGIYMKHSAFWMQRYFNCDYLKITNLTIFNHSNLNSDGIDIDGCHSVVVDNCIVDSSDDAIVLKSEGVRACEDIVISNCVLSSHATALKLGTGSVGGFKRIAINNIVIRPSKATEMIHVMKAWGGICGIDIENVDGGVLEDVFLNNIIIDGPRTPLFIKLGNRNSTWEGKPEAVPGVLRNVRITNLTARNCGMVSSSITGYPGQNVKNIHLSNIDISVTGNTDPADTTTVVPEFSDQYPYNRMFGTELPSYGFYIRHAENIMMENVTLSYEGNDIRPALVLDDTKKIRILGLEAKEPDSDQPFLKQLRSNDIKIINKW